MKPLQKERLFLPSPLSEGIGAEDKVIFSETRNKKKKDELENRDFLQNENSKSQEIVNKNTLSLSKHKNRIEKKTLLKKKSFNENLLIANDLYFLDIENLDLSLRLFTLLKQANIHTLKELVRYSRENLLSIKGLNNNFVDQIEKKLSKIGFSLLKE